MISKRKLCSLVCLVAVCLLGSAYAQEEPIEVGENFGPPLEMKPGQILVFQDVPGALYWAFEIKEMIKRDRLIASDAEGKQRYNYDAPGVGLAIYSDQVILEADRLNSGPISLQPIRGYTEEELLEKYPPGGVLESVCSTGGTLWKDAICYSSSRPDIYAMAQAGVRLLSNGRGLCSGWLVSCQNHILTNNHCVSSQSGINNIQTVFGFQRTDCGTGSNTLDFQVSGGAFLSTSSPLDYTLFIPDLSTAPFDPASTYGWFALDLSVGPQVGQGIFLVGHPSGLPRKISLESNRYPDGFCHLDAATATSCRGQAGAGLRYLCDTAGGSSGSVVASVDTLGAIGLHDCGGCPNVGSNSPALANSDLANFLPGCSYQ